MSSTYSYYMMENVPVYVRDYDVVDADSGEIVETLDQPEAL